MRARFSESACSRRDGTSMLLEEANQRMACNLTLLEKRAIAGRRPAQNDAVRQHLSDLRSGLSTLGMIQQILSGPKPVSIGVLLDSLAWCWSRLAGDAGFSTELDIEEYRLPDRVTLRLALVANALAMGALERVLSADGSVRLHLRFASEADGRAMLTVRAKQGETSTQQFTTTRPIRPAYDRRLLAELVEEVGGYVKIGPSDRNGFVAKLILPQSIHDPSGPSIVRDPGL